MSKNRIDMFYKFSCKKGLHTTKLFRYMPRKTQTGGTAKPNVPVSRETKDRFVQWLHTRKIAEQGRTINSIIEWFLDQPESIKRVVLGWTENMEEEYAAALRHLADQEELGKVRRTPKLHIPGMKTGSDLEEEYRREAASTPGQAIHRRPKQ